MAWKPKYSATIERKLWLLRMKFRQEGKSEQELKEATYLLIEEEKEKSLARRLKKNAKRLAKYEHHKNVYCVAGIDQEGFEVKTHLYWKERITIEEKHHLLDKHTSYSWVFFSSESDSCDYVKTQDFTFEGAEKTQFNGLLEDSYILVLDKLNKNGKRCGKLYVDMLTQKIVKAKELF